MKIERLYFYLGALSLALAIVFLALGLYGTAIGTPDSLLAGGICFMVFLLPAFLFLDYWSRRTGLDRRLRILADVLKGYRQISMEELAGKIDCSKEDAEFLAAACIGRGYVRGRIDPKEEAFISEELAPEKKEPS